MSEWISVKDERKPILSDGEDSISETVLLYVPSWANRRWIRPIVLGDYLHRSRQFRPHGSSGCEKLVTHWMPLPAPPEAEGKQP